MEPTFLAGTLVDLAPLSPDGDLSHYLGWVNSQETTRHMGVGLFPTDTEGLRRYIAALRDDPNGMLLGIIDKSNGAHVGNITLHDIDWKDRRGEIGVLIGDPEARGKGFATEAIGLVKRHAFDRLNLRRLHAGMVDENEASKRAFEKNGFEVEGVLKEHFYVDGVYRDCLRMGVIRSEL